MPILILRREWRIDPIPAPRFFLCDVPVGVRLARINRRIALTERARRKALI